MSLQEKYLVLSVLRNLKILDGYASNISRGVNLKERKLSNLNSHDEHILMHGILPLALRGIMANNVNSAISKVSVVFKK